MMVYSHNDAGALSAGGCIVTVYEASAGEAPSRIRKV